MLKNFLLFFFGFLLALPSISAVWLRPSSIKQGEIIVVTGLYHQFGQSISFLGDCKLEFNNKDFPFYREVVNYEEFKNSGGISGYQFIARIATTPLTKVGKTDVVLACPNGKEAFNVQILAENFPVQNIQLTDSKNSLQKTDKEDLAIKNAINTSSPYRLWDPVKQWVAPNTARRSAAYGLRRTYNGKLAENYFHKGIDFAAFTGGAIVAPAKGKVALVGIEKDGFAVHGNCIFIDHGQGVVSAYLHLSEVLVKQGQEIQAGQLIGKVGDTGIATGPHLHFGIYVNGENVSPEPWLKFPIP
ncbi:MAG: M23 family metallopeptidase [Candidatus Caenarcaniphilales bacterium]|nr:M23 family metallopeptidase [Candidatus Caenarcaniphilales bacterium]